MSKIVYGLLLAVIFGVSLGASVAITHISALSYDVNLPLVPPPNPACTRYLPQFTHKLNLGDPVDFNRFNSDSRGHSPLTTTSVLGNRLCL